MKTIANTETIYEILSCFDKIKTIELAMESLPDEFRVDWRERLKIKEKKEKLGAEIIQLRGILRGKMNDCSISEV
jgi:hypothetical protein